MKLSWTGRLLVLASAAVVACWAPDVPQLVPALRGPSFPDAAIAAGTLLAVAIAIWVLAAATLIGLGASSRVVTRLTPNMLRGALLAGAAGALIVAPAHAAPIAGPDSPLQHRVTGLPLPDRPDTGPAERTASPTAQPVVRPAAHHLTERVVVRPGDTLWSIAAQSLPPGADDAEIAAATAAWHATNRDVIGDDPDLLFPTQRLAPPTGKDLP